MIDNGYGIADDECPSILESTPPMKSPSFPLRRLAYRVWRSSIQAHLSRPDACTLFGLQLVVSPGVLHPRYFASSRLIAGHLLNLDLSGIAVADIGTGSGLLGLLAARAGAHVTATDINPAAVECAGRNAARNGVSDRMLVAQADVFDGLQGHATFQIIVTNPPFYPRHPENAADHAFASGVGHQFFTHLATELPSRLATDGRLLMVHSSDTDFEPISRILEGCGLKGRVVRTRRGLFETLTVREFARAYRT